MEDTTATDRAALVDGVGITPCIHNVPPTIQACHWVIDELKATTPIWKKEHFEDGSIWKENAESRALYAAKKASEGGGAT